MFHPLTVVCLLLLSSFFPVNGFNWISRWAQTSSALFQSDSQECLISLPNNRMDPLQLNVLYDGQTLTATNGTSTTQLTLDDGQLVLTYRTMECLFATPVLTLPLTRFRMQSGVRLVECKDRISWISMNSGGKGPHRAVLRDNGQLVIFDRRNVVLWHSPKPSSQEVVGPFRLTVTVDPSVRIIDANEKIVWQVPVHFDVTLHVIADGLDLFEDSLTIPKESEQLQRNGIVATTSKWMYNYVSGTVQDVVKAVLPGCLTDDGVLARALLIYKHCDSLQQAVSPYNWWVSSDTLKSICQAQR